MNATEAKNARHIRCKGCNEPLATIDAYTVEGFYYCAKCFDGMCTHERDRREAEESK